MFSDIYVLIESFIDGKCFLREKNKISSSVKFYSKVKYM